MANMNRRIRNRKRTQAILATLLIIAILLAGTWAWYNFTQQALNIFEGESKPDVNLHDDHEDNEENKDVYVENSGDRPLYVRVRFSEHMEIDTNSVTGSERLDISTWKKHNSTNSATDPALCRDNEEIHRFYEWIMGGELNISDPDGGWKYFVPAPSSHRGLIDSDGNQIRDPREITYYEENHKPDDGRFNVGERVPVPYYGYNVASLSGLPVTSGVYDEWEGSMIPLIDLYKEINLKLEGPNTTGQGTATSLGGRLDELFAAVDRAPSDITARAELAQFLEDHELGYYDIVYTFDEEAWEVFLAATGSSLLTP